ncbi:MAG: histone deacetylase [Chloroflexi bacterium]|nr:MAG: histone deacetylase [Chloroflexota bacterium]MBL1196035.1 histone deacetylase [Chloroflexota bacterium]NOH13329.1 histone deacetylase [Chloroflexota bacterium]
MKVYYHDLFTFPLPEMHRFPISKYKRLRQAIVDRGIVKTEDLHIPEPATDEQLALAHEREYIEKVKQGTLSEQEIRRMGFPWSPELVERSRRSVGSTIAACRAALEDGVAINLAGGTHHAGQQHGEGFCVFNDAAVAGRVMQAEGLANRVLVIDCDVHQGNGTAAILQDDDSIFTFSIHGEKNFPFRKEASDLDISLPDGTGDVEYINMLDSGLQQAIQLANAELVIYLSGADPFEGDRLGRLALSMEGLAKRDQLVLQTCMDANLPVAVVMAGGYAENVEDIVDIHAQTIRIAGEFAHRLQFLIGQK